jgi:hypothetical protein
MGSPDISDLSFLELNKLSAHDRAQMGNQSRVDVDYSNFDPTDRLALAKWKTPGTITELGGRAMVKASDAAEDLDQQATA